MLSLNQIGMTIKASRGNEVQLSVCVVGPCSFLMWAVCLTNVFLAVSPHATHINNVIHLTCASVKFRNPSGEADESGLNSMSSLSSEKETCGFRLGVNVCLHPLTSLCINRPALYAVIPESCTVRSQNMKCWCPHKTSEILHWIALFFKTIQIPLNIKQKIAEPTATFLI